MKVSLNMKSVLLMIRTGIENKQYEPTIGLIDDLLEQIDKQEREKEKREEKEGTTIAHQPTTDVVVQDKEEK